MLFCVSGRKIAEIFKQVTTLEVDQVLNNAVPKTQRQQPSLLSRFVMVSAKPFTDNLFIYELADYTSAKIFFARLLCCPVFLERLRNYKQYFF